MLCSYQTKVGAIPFCKSDTFKRCNDAVIVPLPSAPLLFCHDTPWGAIQSFNLLLGGPMGGLMLLCCCCIYLALFIPLGMTKQFVSELKGSLVVVAIAASISPLPTPVPISLYRIDEHANWQSGSTIGFCHLLLQRRDQKSKDNHARPARIFAIHTLFEVEINDHDRGILLRKSMAMSMLTKMFLIHMPVIGMEWQFLFSSWKKSYGRNIFHTCHTSSNFLVIAFLREDYYTMYISDDTIYISFV